LTLYISLPYLLPLMLQVEASLEKSCSCLIINYKETKDKYINSVVQQR